MWVLDRKDELTVSCAYRWLVPGLMSLGRSTMCSPGPSKRADLRNLGDVNDSKFAAPISIG